MERKIKPEAKIRMEGGMKITVFFFGRFGSGKDGVYLQGVCIGVTNGIEEPIVRAEC